MNKLVAVAGLFVAVSCSSAAAAKEEEVPAPLSRSDSDVITAEELADPLVATGDAYEAVQRLRPRFLVARSSSSGSNGSTTVVHLSVDGGRLVPVGNLRNYRPSALIEIRFLNGPDAVLRFGAVAGSGGVIVIRSR